MRNILIKYLICWSGVLIKGTLFNFFCQKFLLRGYLTGCCAIEKSLKLLSTECVERTLNLNRLRLAFHEDSVSCVVEITEVKMWGKFFLNKKSFLIEHQMHGHKDQLWCSDISSSHLTSKTEYVVLCLLP